MVCSFCKGAITRPHNRRTCPMNTEFVSSRPDHESRDSKTCGLCGVTGHNRRTCPMVKTGSTMKSVTKVREIEGLAGCSLFKGTNSCSLCGESGHNRRTCTNAARRDIPKREVASKSLKAIDGLSGCSLFKGTKICGLCGKPGHNRRTCKSVEGPPERPQEKIYTFPILDKPSYLQRIFEVKSEKCETARM